MNEIWKDVPGYKGLYQVSNMGHVRSLPRTKCFTDKSHWKAKLKGKQLKSHPSGQKGYMALALWKNSKPHKDYVHRLVLTVFVGKPKKGMVCNHKNGKITDNRLSNLEWVTVAQNNLHAYRILHRSIVSCDGERDGNAKLTWKQVDHFRKLNSNNPDKWTVRFLADKYGISIGHMGKIIGRRSWKKH